MILEFFKDFILRHARNSFKIQIKSCYNVSKDGLINPFTFFHFNFKLLLAFSFLIPNCLHQLVRNGLFIILKDHLRDHCRCKFLFLLLVSSELQEILDMRVRYRLEGFICFLTWIGYFLLWYFHWLNMEVFMPWVRVSIIVCQSIFNQKICFLVDKIGN